MESLLDICPNKLVEDGLYETSVNEIYSKITTLLLFGSKIFKPKPCTLNYEDFAKRTIQNNLRWAREEKVIPLVNIKMWEICCENYFKKLDDNWLRKLYE